MGDSDRYLLESFAKQGDQAAFRTLVSRHLDAVHAVSRRITCNDELAKDVTQNTFIRLARRASSLPVHLPLSVWLHRTCKSLAIDLVRSEERRRRLEAKARPAEPAPEPAWNDLAPLIDGLVDQLPVQDREVVLLRFYRGRSHAEIGRRLGLTDNAARQRTLRAVDRLRTLFRKKGIAISPAGLATLLQANAASPAPASVAAAVFQVCQTIAPVGSIGLSSLAAMTLASKSARVAFVAFAAGALAPEWRKTAPPSPTPVTSVPSLASAPPPRWGANDLKAVFNSADARSRDSAFAPELKNEELSSWSTAELWQALKDSLQSPDQTLSSDLHVVRGQIIGELMHRDLPAFLAWSEQSESISERRYIGRWISITWPKGHAEEGLSWLKEHADFLAGTIGDVSWHIVREAADQRALQGPASVEALLAAIAETRIAFTDKDITFPPGFDFSALAAMPAARDWWESGTAPTLIRGWVAQHPGEAFSALLADSRNQGASAIQQLKKAKVPPEEIATAISTRSNEQQDKLITEALRSYNCDAASLASFAGGLNRTEERLRVHQWVSQRIAGAGIPDTLPHLEALGAPAERIAYLETMAPVRTMSAETIQREGPLLRSKLEAWGALKDQIDRIFERLQTPQPTAP